MEPLIISLCIIVILKLWNLKSDKWVIGGVFLLLAQHSRAHEQLSLEQFIYNGTCHTFLKLKGSTPQPGLCTVCTLGAIYILSDEVITEKIITEF